MCTMIDYIFGSLRASEDTVRNVRKVLRNQSRFNRSVKTFVLTATAYMIVAEIHNHKLKQKIEKLSNEIKELKRTKGE